MVSKLFSNIIDKGIKQGHLPARTEESRKWYRNQAKKLSGITDQKLKKDPQADLANKIAVGQMAFFNYDPKHKLTLPYYDRFPLIFKIWEGKGRMHGLNLHYIPFKQRAMLMDALYEITSNKRFNENTKLQISYDILKSSSKFKWFKPAYKEYIRKHFRSRFVRINVEAWEIAAFLPVAQWSKASQTQVWSDSRKMV